VYHCVNGGSATWHQLALEVKRQLDSHAEVTPVTLADVPLRARRPRYCALANDKLRRAAFTMPDWQDAITRALAAHRQKVELNAWTYGKKGTY
jgi:dTDP-4-dehydrorhamnose reductase